MTENINLLKKKKLKNPSQERALLLIRWASIGCLVITISTSLIFFILTLNPSLSAVKHQEDTTLANLSFTKGKVAKYFIIKDRLDTIGKILQTRYRVDETLGVLEQQFPADVTVETVDIENKTASFTLSSPNLLSLKTIITNMTTLLEKKQVVKRLTIESLTSDGTLANYALSFRTDLL